MLCISPGMSFGKPTCDVNSEIYLHENHGEKLSQFFLKTFVTTSSTHLKQLVANIHEKFLLLIYKHMQFMKTMKAFHCELNKKAIYIYTVV